VLAPVNTLVIDDDTGTLKTLSAILEDMGHQVTACAKGRQAMELVKDNLFHIVITDIKLPDISGLEILEMTKEANPEAAVIMITGHASLETAVSAVNEGAYAYLLKPVTLNELETIINNALREQRLLQENRRLVEDLQLYNKLLEEANSELEQLSQAKSDFMAKMSHELRTPLNSIIGFSEVLLDKSKPPLSEAKHDEFLNYIHLSATHLLHLINSILDLSKIESGINTLECAEFDLSRLLQEVDGSVLPMLEIKEQTLEVEVAKGMPLIYADEFKIRQVFLNLISNAHKFSPMKAKIKVVCQLTKPDILRCSVVDHGIGISPSDQQKIFEEFSQVARGATGVQRGAGLGLAIAKKLVELHGGNMWVDSELDKGSTFTFFIPLDHGRSS